MVRSAPGNDLSSNVFRNVLLCEDVRAEIGNKSTIIGVFSGDVVVSEMPATLQFAVYAEYIPSRFGEVNIKFQFKSKDKLLAGVSAKIGVKKLEPSTIRLPRLFFNFENDTELSLEATIESEKPIQLFSKRVFKGQISGSA